MSLAAALPGRRVWSVSALLAGGRRSRSTRASRACTVRGEISGFSRAASGHCYFTLKDAGRRRALALRHVPARGAARRLRCRGTATRSSCAAAWRCTSRAASCSSSSRRCSAAAPGALYEQFLRLKARLEAEGLFDPARKRAAAAVAARASASSPRSARAALHDVADDAGAARAACAGGRLSEPGAGRRRAGRAVRGDRDRRRPAPRSTCSSSAAAAARSRTCGPSTTSAWCARIARSADAGGERRRPRDRRHPGRPRRRPARADADRGGRAGGAGDRRRRCELLDAHRAALVRRTRSGAGARGAAARPDRPAPGAAERDRWRGAATGSTCWRSGSVRRAGREPGAARAPRSMPARRARHSLLARALARQAGAPRVGGDPPAARSIRSRVLARGYALLRDADGHALSSVGQLRPGQAVRATLQDGDAGAARCERSCLRAAGAMSAPTGTPNAARASCLQSSETPTAREERHGTHPAPAAVRDGRAGAAPERRDARVPLRQAPQGLRRQPEQPAEGHRVRDRWRSRTSSRRRPAASTTTPPRSGTTPSSGTA